MEARVAAELTPVPDSRSQAARVEEIAEAMAMREPWDMPIASEGDYRAADLVGWLYRISAKPATARVTDEDRSAMQTTAPRRATG